MTEPVTIVGILYHHTKHESQDFDFQNSVPPLGLDTRLLREILRCLLFLLSFTMGTVGLESFQSLH